MKPLPKRFLTLEAGRFLAALAVVLFHANVTTAASKYFGYYAAPFFAGGFAGVEFFFVLSGFVIVMAHYGDLQSEQPRATLAKTFVRKRFLRLYPALWALLIVLAPAIYFVKPLQWHGPITAFDIVAAFAIMPFPTERILSVEWTLRYEILFYAAFALLLWKRGTGGLAFAVLMALSVTSYVIELKGIAGFFVSPYPLLFVAGALIAVAARTGKLGPAAPFLITGGAFFLWRLGVCAMTPEHNGQTIWDTTWFGIGAALLIYGLVSLEARRYISVPGWLQYLGNASYAIYLVHFPIVSLAAKAAMKLRGPIPDIALILAIGAIGVFGGVAFHELIEKRLIALTRRLRSVGTAPASQGAS